MSAKKFTDQVGYSFEVEKKPVKIVSLVPSQTELLFYLGLQNEVIGITKFCIHPSDKVGRIAKVGGTKKINFELIDELKPDLILANKEENYQKGIEKLREKYPVWTSDICSIQDSLEMITEIGKLTGKEEHAIGLCTQIEYNWQRIENLYSGTVLYFIWQNPLMVAANDTFINSIINHLGFENLAMNKSRYPEINEGEVSALQPDYIFLSSEPFPFCQKHIDSFQRRFPKSKVILVNGEMFSWYGNRLLKVVDYLESLLP